MDRVIVVAAIIRNEGKLLCTQRGPGGPTAYKWEFPGGKSEVGETLEEALVREISEELDCKIIVEEPYLSVEHTYPGEGGFHIIMYSYICSCIGETLTLNEHVDSIWEDPCRLDELDWAEADWPIVQKLILDDK